MEKNLQSLHICGKHGEMKISLVRYLQNLVLITLVYEIDDNRSDIANFISDSNHDGMLSIASSQLWNND